MPRLTKFLCLHFEEALATLDIPLLKSEHFRVRDYFKDIDKPLCNEAISFKDTIFLKNNLILFLYVNGYIIL